MQLLPEGKVLWPYRDSQTRKWTAIKLEPTEFLRRFLQHILPPNFARVRTFGWLHPAAKVRRNRVRALLGQQPLLTSAEEKKWSPPLDSKGTLEPPPPATPMLTRCSAPLCPRCQQLMRLAGSWRSGQLIPYPKRPP